MIKLEAAVRQGEHHSHPVPIFPLYMGREACTPLHRYGRSRSHYLVHYVASGIGTFYSRDSVHTLGPNRAFLLTPGQEHWYQADAQEPWEYWWIGFEAPPVPILRRWLGVREVPSVLTVTDAEAFRTTYSDLWRHIGDSVSETAPLVLMEKMIAVLRTLVASMLRSVSEGERHETPLGESRWRRVRAFVDAHYCEPMTVETICRAVGTSRTELHRTFVRRTGTTPMRYVADLRMRRAVELLSDSDRPILRIAHLVGYAEYQTFSRVFRRRYGTSPRSFMRERSIDAG